MADTQDGDRRTERTQDSDRTEALSQWVLDQYKGQNKSSGPSQSQARRVPLDAGKTSFIELNFEVSSGPSREDAQASMPQVAIRLEEEDQSSPLSQDGLHTNLFPEEQRFVNPRTPAVSTRKRNHDELETPAPQRNPFGDPFATSGPRSSGPIGLTQAFKNTQAPSSPAGAGLLLPSSERPSPIFAHIQRSPTLELEPSSTLKSAVPPRRQWRQAPSQRDAQASESSPLSVSKSIDLFDQLQRKDESSRERTRSLKEEQKRASRQLSTITAKSSLGQISYTHPRRDHSKSPTEVAEMEESRALSREGLTDDTATESEAETEHEVPELRHADPTSGSSLGDENKENRTADFIRILGSSTKRAREGLPEIHAIHSRQRSSFSVPSSADDGTNQAMARIEGDTQGHGADEDDREAAMFAIADSQRSAYNTPAVNANGPRTSESSMKVIQESQSGKIPDSSEPLKPVLEKNAARSSSLPPPSPSLRKEPSRPNPISRATETQPAILAHNSHGAPKFSSSEGADRRNTRIYDSYDETPARSLTLPTIIPETAFASRRASRRLAQHSSSSTPSATKETARIREAPRLHPPALRHPAREAQKKQLSQRSTSPRSQRPHSLMAITEARLRETQSQSIDMDIEILNDDDKEYAADMEKYSSPLSHTRRRHINRQGNREVRFGNGRVPAASPSKTSDEEDTPNITNATVIETLQEISELTADAAPSNDIPSEDPPGEIGTYARSGGTESREGAPNATQHKIEQKETLSSIARSSQQARVFAHWSGGGGLSFFPATCLSASQNEPRITVRFDYGDRITEIKSNQVKRLELRPGDHVRVDVDQFRNQVYVVEECFDMLEEHTDDPRTDIFGNQRVRVKPKRKSKQLTLLDFPISSLYHELQTWNRFKDRGFETHDASLEGEERQNEGQTGNEYLTPGSKRRNFIMELLDKSFPVAFAPDSKKRAPGLFRGKVFVLTNIPESSRKYIESTIQEHDGKVLKDGFEALFQPYKLHGQLSSAPTSASKRGSSAASRSSPATESGRSGPPSEYHLRLRSSVPDDITAFLITASHCRNTKYFEALALGVPCLSYRWIEQCAAKNSLIPWRHFVLAAGESALLDGAVVSRSLFLPREDTDDCPLRDMLEQRPAWLAQQRVLFVGLDRRSTDAHLFLALALGAGDIMTARDEKEARQVLKLQQDSPQALDFVIYNSTEVFDSQRQEAAVVTARPGKRRRTGKDDTELIAMGSTLAADFRCRVLSTEFIMQSLILGKLLD